jgi:hypothetical protein
LCLRSQPAGEPVLHQLRALVPLALICANGATLRRAGKGADVDPESNPVNRR